MSRVHISRVLAVLIIIGVPSKLHADVAAGQRLAQQWCASCHVIDGSGPSSTLPQGPPSFRVAAGHLDAGELRAWLTHPHGQMPDLSLTRSEIDDLITYIESLR